MFAERVEGGRRSFWTVDVRLDKRLAAGWLWSILAHSEKRMRISKALDAMWDMACFGAYSNEFCVTKAQSRNVDATELGNGGCNAS